MMNPLCSYDELHVMEYSLLAQLLKNLPAMQETTSNAGDPGSILGQEDTLEKEMATHSGILA